MKRLIKNGYVVSDGIDVKRPADVLINDGIISAVGYELEDGEAEIIDAAGSYVYSGFIDMLCTFCDSGHDSVEDI